LTVSKKLLPPLCHLGPPWLGMQGWAASLPRVSAPRQARSVQFHKPGYRRIWSLADVGKASSFNNKQQNTTVTTENMKQNIKMHPQGPLVISFTHSSCIIPSTNSYLSVHYKNWAVNYHLLQEGNKQRFTNLDSILRSAPSSMHDLEVITLACSNISICTGKW
jgi:hypothetical protein